MEQSPGASGEPPKPLSLVEEVKTEVEDRKLLTTEKIGEQDNVYDYPPFNIVFKRLLDKPFPGSGRTIRAEIEEKLALGISVSARESLPDQSGDRALDVVRLLTTDTIKDMPGEMDEPGIQEGNAKILRFKGRLRSSIKDKPMFRTMGNRPDGLASFIAQEVLRETHVVAPYAIQYLKSVDFKGGYTSSGYPRPDQVTRMPASNYYFWEADTLGREKKLANLDASAATEGMGYDQKKW